MPVVRTEQIQNEGEKLRLQRIGGEHSRAKSEPHGDILGKGDNCMLWNY